MSHHILTDGYYGRILNGNYIRQIKRHITKCIQRFQEFDRLGTPAIPYIAAWRVNQHVIWYEFVGRQLIQLLGCDYSDAAESFRNSIMERHLYTRTETAAHFQEEIMKSNEVRKHKSELRDAVKNSGVLDAVYKISAADGKTYWLKDQAKLEAFESDKIFISMGNLTVITKEMEAEEHLKRVQTALRKSEQKFKAQAIHDNLTGLYNTRYLYSALSAMIKKSASSGAVFSLIFMDIDDFKQVVDTYGHPNASKTLQEIAATIKTALPAPAYGVAYGGDEFVMVLPGFDKQQALDTAEIIRQSIKDTIYLQNAGLKVRINSSLGVSTFPDDAETLSDLLSLADQAMFSVKERGKDSVCGISYQTDDRDDGVEKNFSYHCPK